MGGHVKWMLGDDRLILFLRPEAASDVDFRAFAEHERDLARLIERSDDHAGRGVLELGAARHHQLPALRRKPRIRVCRPMFCLRSIESGAARPLKPSRVVHAVR